MLCVLAEAASTTSAEQGVAPACVRGCGVCEFCHKHGEGQRWYLRAENYSEDLLGDLRRRRFIQSFFSSPQHLIEGEGKLGRLNQLPSFVRSVVTPIAVNRQKKSHYGQVVPIEEVERIFAFVNSVVRLP